MTTAEAREHWSKLADETEELAVWWDEQGYGGQAKHNKAKLYRRTAEALRLKEETGEAHCVCHLKPFSSFTHDVFKKRWASSPPAFGTFK